MEKKKIYHIHTDFKFLYDSYRFENEFFENEIVFIGEKDDSNKLYHDSAIFFSDNDEQLDALVKRIRDADLIVFYGLCDAKKKILNEIPSGIKKIWRFFGYEFYGTRHDLVFSKRTLEVLYKKKSFTFGFLYWLNINFNFFKQRIKNGKELGYIKKIDYILLFSEEEYIYLKKYWKVPKFLKLNLDEFLEENNFKKSKPQVIVGNSRNHYNNHLDIIDLIPKNYSHANFIFFLNYGNKGSYYKKVVEQISGLEKHTIYDNFLNKDEFERIYSNSSAFVLNGYRQMALGNIFLALKYGLKLYLNDRNPLQQWLRNLGVKVSSINDFPNDLINQNISLTENERIENLKAFNKLFLSYTKEDFCNQVYQVLN